MNKISKKYRLWFGVAVLAGCTSVADMVGYDTAALNEGAERNYTQIVQKARSQNALDVSSPTAHRVQPVFSRLVP